MSTTPQNGAELLARIRPVLAIKSVDICLRPDLITAWEDAGDALVEAQAEDSTGGEGRMADRKGPSPKTRRAAKKVQDLETEIKANAITFTFRALPKDKWRELCEQHPPRKGNNIDQYLGHDKNAVEDAAIRLCMIDPVFDDAAWGEFLAVCNPGEWGELREAVREVNGSVTNLPKSQLASQILAKRGPTSKQPATGA